MPLVISVIAFAIFIALLLFNRIGEASFCFLTAAAALLGLVLHGFGRLQELDLKNLRLVLREIEQTKKDLFVREERLKAIALPLAQLIALTGATGGRLGSREFWDVQREWYTKKLHSLVTALELSPTESQETQKYTDKYAEIDKVLGGRGALMASDPDYEQTKQRLEKLGDELIDMLRADIAK